MKLATKTLLSCTAVAAITGSAQAATILVDFGTSSGSSAPASFNTVTANTTDLNDDTATPTAVDISLDFLFRSGFAGGNTGGPSAGGTDPFLGEGVLNDGLYAFNEGSFIITLSDLSVSTQYDFEFINGRSSGAAAGDATIAVTLGSGSGGTALNDGTVLSLSVISDSNGDISFTVTDDDTSGDTLLSAMSITEVPEPGSLALLGLSGLLIGFRRRRA